MPYRPHFVGYLPHKPRKTREISTYTCKSSRSRVIRILKTRSWRRSGTPPPSAGHSSRTPDRPSRAAPRRRRHHDGERGEEQLCRGGGAGRGRAGRLCAPPDGFRRKGEWGEISRLPLPIPTSGSQSSANLGSFFIRANTFSGSCENRILKSSLPSPTRSTRKKRRSNLSALVS